MQRYETAELLYENPLAEPDDVTDWILEGDASVTFPKDRMRLNSVHDPEEVDVPHFVYWCPESFPDDVAISWDFWPVAEPGLCMIFFAAKGRDGGDVHDDDLADRSGDYPEYYSGDIDALHASYYRRNHHGEPWAEREFQTINLRKSHGFHLVAEGGDPMPNVRDANPPYPITVVKSGPDVSFYVDELEVFHWRDDGESTGDVLGGGKIGFRQMAPFTGEYANLSVHAVEPSQ